MKAARDKISPRPAQCRRVARRGAVSRAASVMVFCGAALAALVWPEAEGGVVSRADFASAQVRNNSPTDENKTANSETTPPAPRVAAKPPTVMEIPATAEGGATPPDVHAPLRMDGGEVALWDFNERSFSAADKMPGGEAATPSIAEVEKTAVAAVEFNPAGDSFTDSWTERDRMNPDATTASANPSPILVANVLRGWAHPGIIPRSNPNYYMVMALRSGDLEEVERFLRNNAKELKERVEGGKFTPHEATFRGYDPNTPTVGHIYAHRYSLRLKQTILFRYYDRIAPEHSADFAKALMCYGFDPLLPDSDEDLDSIQLALRYYTYFGRYLPEMLNIFFHGVDCDYNLNYQYRRRGVKATHQITYQGRPFNTFYDSEKYMEQANELLERFVDRHGGVTMLRAAVLKILDKAVEREPCACSCACVPPDTGESCTCSCSCSN